MIWQVVISTVAETELTEAYDWYELQSPGLGQRLTTEVDKIIEKISLQPRAYSIKVKGYRSVSIASFPYLIIYEMVPEIGTIHVLQVFHTARYPD